MQRVYELMAGQKVFFLMPAREIQYEKMCYNYYVAIYINAICMYR